MGDVLLVVENRGGGNFCGLEAAHIFLLAQLDRVCLSYKFYICIKFCLTSVYSGGLNPGNNKSLTTGMIA